MLVLFLGVLSLQTWAGSAKCYSENAGLVVPDGCCAPIVADDLAPAHHFTVPEHGDVIVTVTVSDDRGGRICRMLSRGR